MALTAEQKQKIKCWARETYLELRGLPADTVPVRIKSNRDRLLPHFLEREDIDTLKEELPAQVKEFLRELVRLLHEYEHYFDNGYRSCENIDTLPDKIKDKLAKLMRTDL